MSKASIIERLDATLKPLGFSRQGTIWNRPSELSVDVFDMQISRDGNTFTLSAGMLDKAVHEVFWGEAPPKVIEQPQCTVGVRIGALIDGKDKWWDLDSPDDGSVPRALEQSIQLIVRFLESVRTRERMVQWLEDTEVTKKRYPLPIINLAVLQALLERPVDARATLDNLETKVSGAWKDRVAQVRERIPSTSKSGPFPGSTH